MISVKFRNTACGKFDRLDKVIMNIRDDLGTSYERIRESERTGQIDECDAHFMRVFNACYTIDRLYNNELGKRGVTVIDEYKREAIRLENVEKLVTSPFETDALWRLEGHNWWKEINDRAREWYIKAQNYRELELAISAYLRSAVVTWSGNRAGNILFISATSLLEKKTFKLSRLLTEIFGGKSVQTMYEENLEWQLTNVATDKIYNYFSRMFNLIERDSFITSYDQKHIDLDQLMNIGVLCLLYNKIQPRKKYCENWANYHMPDGEQPASEQSEIQAVAA